jgi:hypothetical protein
MRLASFDNTGREIMKRNPIAAFFPVLCACLCLSACVSDTETEYVASEKTQWKQEEPARYSYTLEEKSVWIAQKVRVSAVRDSVIAVRDLSVPGNELPVMGNPKWYSLDSVFARIEIAAKDNPKDLRYTFNAEFGYPESVEFPGLPDTKSTLTISGFQVDILR